jgi:uncharacterized beta-barrel protein YwiB (DUF1934 family)
MEKVIINIKGLQDLGSMDMDEMELETEGEYGYGGGAATLRYMESELTGLDGTVTSFVVDSEKVSMTRRGTVNTQMVFQKGYKHYFVYETLYGAITMGLETHSISTQFDEGGGEMEIHYIIDIDNSVKNKNMISVRVRRA